MHFLMLKNSRNCNYHTSIWRDQIEEILWNIKTSKETTKLIVNINHKSKELNIHAILSLGSFAISGK